MALTDMQQAIYAYFLAHQADQFSMAGRFFPKADVEMILRDKITMAVKKFGPKVAADAGKVADHVAAELIEKGGFSTVKPDIGLPMHQFQDGAYKEAIAEMKAASLPEDTSEDAFKAKFDALTGA